MGFRRSATEELIRRVLNDNYLSLRIHSYQIEEHVAEGAPCKVTVSLYQADAPDHHVVIEGEGSGFIDAVYNGFMEHYAREFHSLETISFTGFEVKGKMETSRHKRGPDAEGLVALSVQNSGGHTFNFEESGRSVIAAGLCVVTEALEYFVNSERAFVSVYRARCDAVDRGRSDLTQTFTAQLAELVNTTSYTEVIETIKAEALMNP